MATTNPQIPAEGPLSTLDEEAAWTGASEKLYYGGEHHLRKCFRIPLDLLHFNIRNGRYATKFKLLEKANPGVNIDETDAYWKKQMFDLLSGNWKDTQFGLSTESERRPFLDLADDIREREQEKPGIVLETGGVMSGNRRLAALMSLFGESQNPRFRYFEACIVPSEGEMSSADRWCLEMAAQVGQGRLTKGYDAMDKLLKIREGVQYFSEQNPDGGEGSATKAVATAFARDPDEIKHELTALRFIEEYLNAIGHPEEWWLAAGLTEIFTEIGPLMEACETNAMALEDRSRLKRSVFQITRHDLADYRLIRDIRASVGPRRMRRGARRMPTVTRILIDNAPAGSELQRLRTNASENATEEVVERFRSEFQANKDKEAPLMKAERAESNLRMLVEILCENDQSKSRRAQSLIESLRNSRSLADQALKIMQG